MGNGYLVQMEKNTELEMGKADSLVTKHKIKVNQQIKGTISLTQKLSP